MFFFSKVSRVLIFADWPSLKFSRGHIFADLTKIRENRYFEKDILFTKNKDF